MNMRKKNSLGSVLRAGAWQPSVSVLTSPIDSQIARVAQQYPFGNALDKVGLLPYRPESMAMTRDQIWGGPGFPDPGLFVNAYGNEIDTASLYGSPKGDRLETAFLAKATEDVAARRRGRTPPQDPRRYVFEDYSVDYNNLYQRPQEEIEWLEPRIDEILQRHQQEEKNQLDVTLKLRDRYARDSGRFIDIRSSYGRVLAAAKDPSAAGDVSLIFAYMRMLDPTSVVREGEQATARNTGSVPERVWALYNNVLAGQRFSPPQRVDFVNRAGMIFKDEVRNQDELIKYYRQQAINWHVNPNDVIHIQQLPNGDLWLGNMTSPGGIQRDRHGNTFIDVEVD